MEDKEKLEKIIQGCIRNDRRAQEELFKLFYGKMLAVCMRYISDRDSAQEVLQEGFIKIFEKLEVFDYKGSLEGWIRRIVANTAIDSIRKNKRNPYLSDNDTDFVSDTFDPMAEREEHDFYDLKAELALEAIQQLSPAYRTVFNLYVMENYSHREISELLGISEGTSKSNLAKAKMNLQKILSEKFLKIN